jgi:Tfp pilus assembly protein PilF
LKLEDSAEAHLSLARVYLSMNQTDLARAQGQAALNLDPGNQQALQLMQHIQAGTPAGRKTP